MTKHHPTVVPASEWWKHLRPWVKRKFWHADRRQGRAEVEELVKEAKEPSVKWWSSSKHEYVSLRDMHTAHLLSAFKKLERGEYVVGPLGEMLTPIENQTLRMEFDEEFKRRSVGPYAPDEEEDIKF